MRERDREEEREGGSKLLGVSFYEDAKPVRTFVTLFNLYYLLRVLISNIVTLGLRGFNI